MDSATEIGRRGVRTVQAGMVAVSRVAGKVPGVVRKAAGGNRTGTTPEYVIVEDLPDDLRLTKDEEARMTTLIERAREWGKERDQRWLERGRLEGERDLVMRMVTRRFGPGAADDLAPVLARVSNPDRIAAIAARVSECETAEELVVWAQGA